MSTWLKIILSIIGGIIATILIFILFFSGLFPYILTLLPVLVFGGIIYHFLDENY